MTNQNILLERHKDLVNVVVRCRIAIDEIEDPTMLDITTDIRSLLGVVTVRQTRPISDPINTQNNRIAELYVAYNPTFIKQRNPLVSLMKSIKSVEGISMIKAVSHDDLTISALLEKTPLVL